MIFNYNYKIDLKKILDSTDVKEIKILDFGCGKGIWDESKVKKIKKIKKIILFDTNKDLKEILKKKYSSKKFLLNFNLNSILKKKDYNLIIFSSIIQYLSCRELFNLINKLSKRKIVILIIDIPYLYRFIEFFLLPFFNLRRFFFVINLIFSRNYHQTKYYLYKKNNFIKYYKKFNITYRENFHDLKILRYSIILQKRN